MKPYKFAFNCVGVPKKDVNFLIEMIDNSRKIKWETFRKHVDVEELKPLLPSYSFSFNGQGMHPKDDPYVFFCKSKYKGEVCYYMSWSAIEFVFLKEMV